MCGIKWMFHALENNHSWREAHSIRTAEKPLAFHAKSMSLGFGGSIQYTVITARCPSYTKCQWRSAGNTAGPFDTKDKDTCPEFKTMIVPLIWASEVPCILTD